MLAESAITLSPLGLSAIRLVHVSPFCIETCADALLRARQIQYEVGHNRRLKKPLPGTCILKESEDLVSPAPRCRCPFVAATSLVAMPQRSQAHTKTPAGCFVHHGTKGQHADT